MALPYVWTHADEVTAPRNRMDHTQGMAPIAFNLIGPAFNFWAFVSQSAWRAVADHVDLWYPDMPAAAKQEQGTALLVYLQLLTRH
eukprot:6306139-Amphidinium_carterae.2